MSYLWQTLWAQKIRLKLNILVILEIFRNATGTILTVNCNCRCQNNGFHQLCAVSALSPWIHGAGRTMTTLWSSLYGWTRWYKLTISKLFQSARVWSCCNDYKQVVGVYTFTKIREIVPVVVKRPVKLGKFTNYKSLTVIMLVHLLEIDF